MRNMEQEIREAREAGARALNSLRQAQSHLDSARNWGLLDLFGGGWISTMIKHGEIDEARQCIQKAQWDLRSFSRELQDVNLSGIDLDGFATFADFFLDGFLADYLVQRRINGAREQVAQAIDRVEDILRQLRAMQ